MHQESIQSNQKLTSLTTAVAASAAGDIVAGPTLLMSGVDKGTLSARCVFLAQTTSITLSALWEVSRDGTTWVQARGATNATPVAIGTGTGGVDTAVTRQVDAPAAVYSHRYARCSVLTGGASGSAGDQASVSYDFIQDPGL
jgi:hypothetical protein